jgi:hypothetical protein
MINHLIRQIKQSIFKFYGSKWLLRLNNTIEDLVLYHNGVVKINLLHFPCDLIFYKQFIIHFNHIKIYTMYYNDLLTIESHDLNIRFQISLKNFTVG